MYILIVCDILNILYVTSITTTAEGAAVRGLLQRKNGEVKVRRNLLL